MTEPKTESGPDSPRLVALRAMVTEDPDDLLARLLLGGECLGVDRPAEAAEHLSHYVSRFEGDKGAACLSLARALDTLGDARGAQAAIDLGLANARAHRHLQLAASLEAERARIAGV